MAVLFFYFYFFGFIVVAVVVVIVVVVVVVFCQFSLIQPRFLRHLAWSFGHPCSVKQQLPLAASYTSHLLHLPTSSKPLLPQHNL